MARSGRHDDGTRGGIGTMPRSGARPRPAPVPAAPVPDQRRARPARPAPPQRAAAAQQAGQAQQPGTCQRPVPGQRPGPGRGAGPEWRAVPGQRGEPGALPPAVPGSRRMPFVFLLFGLLGGALVSALVISTTLAEGAFEITSLQQQASALARQRQSLEEQVAQARSAQVIAARAARLGMRQPGELRYVDLKTGKTYTDQNTGWERFIHAPGYTP